MFNRNPITRCADGWEISIQDSKAAYVSDGTVECGFPSSPPNTRAFEELGESADGEYYPYSPIPADDSGRLQAIYPYVPYQVLWNEIATHGFIADDSPYKPYFLMKWAYEEAANRVLALLVKDNKQESRILAREASIDYLEKELAEMIEKYEKVSPTP